MKLRKKKGTKKKLRKKNIKKRKLRKKKGVEEEEQEKNKVEGLDDGIKIVNAHTFHVHFQPNATGDSIISSAMKKSFDSFRTILKENGYTKEAQGVIVLTLLSEDIKAFNNYPWGHDKYELTVKYLLAPLSPKTNNLFDFPWAFMAWAFEVIPHLRHQVVHPWLVQAEKELQMPSLITVGLVETLFDLVMDNVKRKFLGATTIKRARLDDQSLVVLNEDDMVDAAVKAGVNIGVDVGVQVLRLPLVVDALAFYVKSARNMMSQAVNEFKNKRGVKVIPSKNVRDPYTPQAKRRKKIFYQSNTKFEEENIWRITNGRRREIVGIQACEAL
ncbi:hypothetical protein KY284_026307 [Solanum tuberosum]|nr:hypothetical protein KY284_026307 [Solanum tuberosum]